MRIFIAVSSKHFSISYVSWLMSLKKLIFLLIYWMSNFSNCLKNVSLLYQFSLISILKKMHCWNKRIKQRFRKNIISIWCWRIISFRHFFRKHSPQKINYEIYDKEFLIIIKIFKKWRFMWKKKTIYSWKSPPIIKIQCISHLSNNFFVVKLVGMNFCHDLISSFNIDLKN